MWRRKTTTSSMLHGGLQDRVALLETFSSFANQERVYKEGGAKRAVRVSLSILNSSPSFLFFPGAAMGGSGSTQGSRKVSFELDEHEQVRVLQGIRLSEDVVNRMKEKSQPKQDQRSQEKSKVSTGICPPTTESLGQKPSEAKEDLYKRYEQEQAMVQEELLRLAKREEAVSQSLNAALQQERISDQEGKQKASHLAKELQWKDEELKRRDTFYKEQLAKIEKKNSEIYKLTLDQYNEAVTNAEDQIRRRNTQPICANLQEAIMMCYNENKQQVLNCSELVKEYQRCVRLAQKELLVHFD